MPSLMGQFTNNIGQLLHTIDHYRIRWRCLSFGKAVEMNDRHPCIKRRLNANQCIINGNAVMGGKAHAVGGIQV